MIGMQSGSVLSKILTTGFMLLLPMLLVGCGGTGKKIDSASLNNSAAITPAIKAEPPVITDKNKLALAKDPNVAVLANTKLAPAAPVKPEIAVKHVVTTVAAKPPAPVRRPYRKLRAKKSVANLAKKKQAQMKKTAKLAPRLPAQVKPVVKKLPVVNLKPKPVVKAPKIVKAVKPRMVPKQVLPVQIMPSNVPQDIKDAFNEAPAEENIEPEKVAKVQPKPDVSSFGQANHRFSGQ